MNFEMTYNGGGYVAPTVPLVMLLWFPLVLYLFMQLPGQRAIVLSFVLAWLFLPEATLVLPGIPDYTKMSATCYGIFLATLLFNAQKLQFFKLSWIDIPILLYCIAPFFSSMSNGLGLYDGITGSIEQTVTWGFPYFLGRIYLNTLKGMRMLAIAVFIGGLAYIPLCLFEVRFSPQLHAIIYGSHAFADFAQAMRMDGFRPTVLMRHGLAVGGWMMAATLTGIGLWKTGALTKVRGIPMKILVPVMLVGFTLLKSTGAYMLLVIGLGIMAAAWYFRTAILALALIVSLSVYLYQNALTETYITDQIITSLESFVPEERIASLEFRFNNEELLADKARQRKIFGWGGWGRNRIIDEDGNDVAVTDSLWIIVFGVNGLFGLTAIFGSFFLSVFAFIRRYPAKLWSHPQVAPAALMATVLLLYMMDSVLNAMSNPVFSVMCGGIAGVAVNQAQTRLAPVSRKGELLPIRPPQPAIPSPSPDLPTAPSPPTSEQEGDLEQQTKTGIGGGRSLRQRRSLGSGI
ncbi:MAG TPA: hypothetical protein V6D20_01410 [Candidatus Obscuribacterales bacterium]